MKKITTSVSDEIYEIAKKNRWKWSELVSWAAMNKKLIVQELIILREGNDKIQRKLTEFGTRIWKLEEKVEDLNKEVELLKRLNKTSKG